MSPASEAAVIPAQRGRVRGGVAVAAVVGVRGSSWRNGAGGEGGGHRRLTASVPKQIRAFCHLARRVERPASQVLTHVLGESPQKEAEKDVAWWFAFR